MSKRKTITFLILGSILLITVFFLFDIFNDLPKIDQLTSNFVKPSFQVADREGIILYEAIVEDDGGYHSELAFEQFPECIIDATLAIEDKNFYSNWGIDLEGMIRAAWINLQGKQTIAGGSTITQQIAKNLLLQDEFYDRTVRRKLREIVLALQITQAYSKDEILTIYLNQIYYGGLAYGVEAASQIYFDQSVSQVNLPECALLAGLTQAPSFYNPLENPTSAKLRQEDVLAAMLDQGVITQEEFDAAVQFPLQYNPAPYPILAPHFVGMVVDEVRDLIEDGTVIDDGGLVVYTTLDLSLQSQAEEIVRRNIASYQRQDGLNKNVNNAALVSLDPKTGEILALVGSAGYNDESIDGKINMADEKRQPGSAFKPIIYAAVLDPTRPEPWTAATTILDVTTTFILSDGSAYTPLNYDYKEHGPVPLRMALGSSLNIPAVKALDHIGVRNAIQLASSLGITPAENMPRYDLSYALGGGEMTLLELTGAYAAFANQGEFVPHQMILRIENKQKEIIYQPTVAAPEQIFSREVAWLISDILSDDAARAIGFGANSILKLDRPAAVKTGTTSNYHDNWTIGYTPDLVAGVWVGNSDYKSMRDVTGLTGAAPIWHDFMRAALVNTPVNYFERPKQLVSLEVCTLSGLLPTDLCQVTHYDWFIPGTEPSLPDNIYQLAEVDAATGKMATSDTPQNRIEEIIVLDLPTEAQRWANAQGFLLLSELQAPAQSEENQSAGLLQIISPTPYATYQISPDYSLDNQQLLIQGVVGASFSQVTFYVDGLAAATIDVAPYEYWWTLEVGEHTIWLEGITEDNAAVSSDTLQITVLGAED